jgi:predicted nuclease with TOPRIM domain
MTNPPTLTYSLEDILLRLKQKIDRQFAEVNQKFAEVNQKLDKQFEKVDDRLTKIELGQAELLQEVKAPVGCQLP